MIASRFRTALVGAVLAAAALAVPAGAAAPTSFPGTAGSWASVTVQRQLVLDPWLSSVKAMSADRGSFVGFAHMSA